MKLRLRLPGAAARARLRRTFAWFRPALEGQRRGVLLAIGLTLLGVGVELLRPWPVKLVFDAVLMPPAGAARPDGAGLLLALAAGLIIAIALAAGLLNLVRAVVLARLGKKVATRVRRRVFEHLHRLAFPFHLSSRTGDLLVRVMGDVNMVRDLLITSWVSIIGRAALVFGTLAVMLVLSPWLTLVAVAPLPVLFLTVRRSSRRLKAVTVKQRRKEGSMAAFAAETLRQIRVVKAYAGEEEAGRSFARFSRSGEREGARATRIAAGMGLEAELVTAAGLAGLLLFGAGRVLAGTITAGDLLVLISYARSLYKPLRGAPKEATRLAKAAASAERLIDVLEQPPEEGAAGAEAPAFAGRVAFEDVSCAYEGGAAALDGLDVEVPAGALAAIEGPNGSGKSTLIALLLRLIAPASGRITIDGRPIEDFGLDGYRGRLAYVPQDVQLFGATVRENILYGRPDADDDAVRKAAAAAQLDEVIARLPQGLDTPLGEGGATLSGGEARRLMLARAALRDARILLLDEPFAGLDPAAAAAVAGAIRTVAAGRTALVVTHGAVDALDPDLRIRLERGRVAGITRRTPASEAALR